MTDGYWVSKHLPDGVEDEEGVVKRGFLWVVFQGKEDGVAEPHPSDEAEGDKAVPRGTLVQVQHLTRVKELQGKSQRSGVRVQVRGQGSKGWGHRWEFIVRVGNQGTILLKVFRR